MALPPLQGLVERSGVGLLVRATNHGAVLLSLGTVTLFGVVLGISRPSHVAFSLPNLVKFMETTEGRDKWYRSMQYLARAISYFTGGLPMTIYGDAHKDFREMMNALSDARKITKFSLQPKELQNLLVKNRDEKVPLARRLLDVKAVAGIIMICFQNAEWLGNHGMLRAADKARVARRRGFFWAIQAGVGCFADIISVRAHAAKERKLQTRLASLRVATPSDVGGYWYDSPITSKIRLTHRRVTQTPRQPLLRASKSLEDLRYEEVSAHTGGEDQRLDDYIGLVDTPPLSPTRTPKNRAPPPLSLATLADTSSPPHIPTPSASVSSRWKRQLEQRAVHARISLEHHRIFVKRASLIKSMLDFICGCK
jgi:hypothetical protein